MHQGRYLLWSLAVSMAVVFGVIVSALVVPSLDMLYREYGPLENMTFALWLVSAIAAMVAYRRGAVTTDRLAAFWVAAFACLAAFREADGHHLLTAATIGRFGASYRFKWFLDPQVNLPLRLGHGALVVFAAACVIVPLVGLRSRLWRLLRAADAAVVLLVLAAVGLGMGYSMDEFLRGSHLMTKAVRQLSEETSELLGSIAYCAASLLLLQTPVTARIRHVETRLEPSA